MRWYSSTLRSAVTMSLLFIASCASSAPSSSSSRVVVFDLTKRPMLSDVDWPAEITEKEALAREETVKDVNIMLPAGGGLEGLIVRKAPDGVGVQSIAFEFHHRPLRESVVFT